jgi:hypothetical protein
MAGTLTKFGVPIFGQSPNKDLLQLKFKYRFRVYMIGFGLSSDSGQNIDFTQQVQSVSRPSVDFAEIPVHSYNSTAYMAGKHTWSDLTCTVKDDVTNSVSTLVNHQLQKQLNFYDQQATSAGINYKFEMLVQMLDGTTTGNALESWSLEGCYLKNVNFQELDYGASEFMNIQMTIKFDNATAAELMTSATGTQVNPSLTSNPNDVTLD